MCLQKLMFMLH